MVIFPVGPSGAPSETGLVDQRWWECATLVATELVLLVVLLRGYDLVVPHAVGNAVAARAHGHAVWTLESDLGLNVETTWYAALDHHPLVRGAANVYYAYSIYLAPILVAVSLVVRDVESYRAMRSPFLASTLVAYAAFWLYPVAPPCLLPGSGLLCHEPSPPDPFAAMPSLHVAWACATALGLGLLTPRLSARILGAAHVAITVAVVLATGHHFVLDALAGVAVLVVVHLVRHRVLAQRGRARTAEPSTDSTWSARGLPQVPGEGMVDVVDRSAVPSPSRRPTGSRRSHAAAPAHARSLTAARGDTDVLELARPPRTPDPDKRTRRSWADSACSASGCAATRQGDENNRRTPLDRGVRGLSKPKERQARRRLRVRDANAAAP